MILKIGKCLFYRHWLDDLLQNKGIQNTLIVRCSMEEAQTCNLFYLLLPIPTGWTVCTQLGTSWCSIILQSGILPPDLQNSKCFSTLSYHYVTKLLWESTIRPYLQCWIYYMADSSFHVGHHHPPPDWSDHFLCLSCTVLSVQQNPGSLRRPFCSIKPHPK